MKFQLRQPWGGVSPSPFGLLRAAVASSASVDARSIPAAKLQAGEKDESREQYFS